MDLEKEVLYAGLDDSNHGLFPEACCACFSTLQRDSFLTNIPKKRDPSFASMMQSPYRNYRFLLLSESDLKAGIDNLAIAAPHLIVAYLGENPFFKEICIYVDGKLNGASKKHIRSELEGVFESIKIKGFIKTYERDPRNRKVKVYKQPLILGIADFQAHFLHSEVSLGQLQRHPKRVVFQR